MHIKLSQADGPTITPMDVLHMRAAEMYLIEAEAYARQNKNAEAQDVLYTLVSARDAGYVKSTNTGQALVDEILIQRRLELFLEGHRRFDMLRNDEELDLTGSGANPDLYLDGYQQDKPSVNPKWLFLIPQREINANPNMVQNQSPLLALTIQGQFPDVITSYSIHYTKLYEESSFWLVLRIKHLSRSNMK